MRLENRNRRFLAITCSSEKLEFGKWKQLIGQLLASSGKLQRVDSYFYIEFKGTEITPNYQAGVDVIGMETGLPHNGLQTFDYGPQSWERVEVNMQSPFTVAELAKNLPEIDNAYKGIRFVQIVNWMNEEFEVKYYFDFLLE